MPRFLFDRLIEHHAIIHISEDRLFTNLGYEDKRFERKFQRTVVEPTPEVWARYYAAKNALRVLEEYEYTEWGGPDYGTEVPEPTSRFQTDYTETREEWLDRCRALQSADISCAKIEGYSKETP